MFNEVSNLLWISLDTRRTEENNREYRPEPLGIRSFSRSVSRMFSSLLLISSGDPNKLPISLTTFATGNDRARDSLVVMPKPVRLDETSNSSLASECITTHANILEYFKIPLDA
jgi:hypothetical protein